jgi:hypothetical protein
MNKLNLVAHAGIALKESMRGRQEGEPRQNLLKSAAPGDSACPDDARILACLMGDRTPSPTQSLVFIPPVLFAALQFREDRQSIADGIAATAAGAEYDLLLKERELRMTLGTREQCKYTLDGRLRHRLKSVPRLL